jgi:hypothetical protein
MILSPAECDMIADAIGRHREAVESFRRSRRGNLWCRLDNLTLTIFEQPKGSGLFSWCVADRDGPHFSNFSFESEEAAVANVLEALHEMV